MPWAAIVSQVGHSYVGPVDQFYIGANEHAAVTAKPVQQVSRVSFLEERRASESLSEDALFPFALGGRFKADNPVDGGSGGRLRLREEAASRDGLAVCQPVLSDQVQHLAAGRKTD